MNDTLLSATEVSRLLGLHVASLWRLTSRGEVPAPVYVSSRRPRWRAAEIEAWLEARRMTPREARARRRAATAHKAA